MTFSIAGRCRETGMVGVAVCSSSIAVASRCAHVRAGVGAVLTQSTTDPALGPRALDWLEEGLTARGALDRLRMEETTLPWRQLVIVAMRGEPAVFTGTHALGLIAEAVRADCGAAGNLLNNETVPAMMADAFEQSRGHLAERLLLALQAGLDAGGETGPVHAAGLKVAHELSWPIVDLRVDLAEEPVAQLWMLWRNYRPQLDAYVTRARTPDLAPPFGVPGEGVTHGQS